MDRELEVKLDSVTIHNKYVFDTQKSRIGGGAFGDVYRARCKQSGQMVALKSLRQGPNQNGIDYSFCREIALLSELSHENIVRLRDIALSPKTGAWLVFDFAESDLSGILKRSKSPLAPLVYKTYLWQILNGVDYLHRNWIMHRDLKPTNILVQGSGLRPGSIKLADFGLARIFRDPLVQLNPNVVTIWYRPPELILGARHYTPSIDIWSVGCIFAELITGSAIFRGEQDKKNSFQADQLRQISLKLGRITPQIWSDVVSLPYWPYALRMYHTDTATHSYTFERRMRTDLPLYRLTDLGYNLLLGMLRYNPSNRISAEKILRDKYFDETPIIRNRDTNIRRSNAIALSPNNQLSNTFLPQAKRTSTNNDGYENRSTCNINSNAQKHTDTNQYQSELLNCASIPSKYRHQKRDHIPINHISLPLTPGRVTGTIQDDFKTHNTKRICTHPMKQNDRLYNHPESTTRD